MKAREYAISLGLAKAGRGKLSKEAHAAIQKAIEQGKTFDDYNDGKVVKNGITSSSTNANKPTGSRNSGNTNSKSSEGKPNSEEPAEIQSRPVTHEYNTIYGIDVRGRSPLIIAFQYCSKCVVQVTYCSHEIPQLPEWIGGGDGLITKPTEEEAWHMYTTQTADTQITKL